MIQMSGRRAKTERKKAAAKGGRPMKVVEVPVEEPQVFFEDVLLAFLRDIGQRVGQVKSRGGAQMLGPVATSICATEALDLGRSTGRPQEYLSAAAYALVAAMQRGKAWNVPPKPAPAPEQTPESPETPPEPSEEATK